MADYAAKRSFFSNFAAPRRKESIIIIYRSPVINANISDRNASEAPIAAVKLYQFRPPEGFQAFDYLFYVLRAVLGAD